MLSLSPFKMVSFWEEVSKKTSLWLKKFFILWIIGKVKLVSLWLRLIWQRPMTTLTGFLSTMLFMKLAFLKIWFK